jgi:hypothetical protein
MRWAALLCVSCGHFGFGASGDPDAAETAAADAAMADAGVVDASIDANPLDNGLLFELPFDGTLVDVGPGQYVTSCLSQHCPTLVAGRVGSGAAQFSNAGTTCLSLPDDPKLHPSVYTLSLWAKVANTTTSLAVKQVSPANGTYSIDAFVESDLIRARVGVDGTVGPMNDNAWHHVAITFDGTVLELFLDGSFSALITTTTLFVYSNEPYLFGCDINGVSVAQHFLDGDLDEVRLYNRVLQPIEIAALANQ